MNTDNQIEVLIVEDSLVGQELLTHVIEHDPALKVMHKVKSAEEALQYLSQHKPDVISMDINLPGMDGYRLTQKIMETCPVPIVIISGYYSKSDVQKSFKAIEMGAVSILEKPAGPADPEFPKKAETIRSHLKMASRTKIKRGAKISDELHPLKAVEKEIEKTEIRCVAIGGSLGGPPALREIFSKLPGTFPVPIFVVQHISPGFTKGLVEWLRMGTELKICLGEHLQKAEPGTIYVAPDRSHMLVDSKNVIHLDLKAKPGEIQPSVGKLFESVVKAHGQKCIGVILTGMGSDGAKELLLIKQRGGATIAQDKESSIMFGMAAEAVKLGAVKSTDTLPLDQIPDRIIKLLYKR